MKAVGIIAEYNPFHNGHLYQIEEVKRLTGADYIVVAMSGDFLQRGVPALTDKYTRAKLALQNQVDLVLEIPVLWSCASAEYYGAAGVRLLADTGIVDTIAFGAETDDLEALQQIANLLAEEPEEYRVLLQSSLKEGLSFPAARAKAVATCLGDDALSSILEQPNNILAIEYLKAMKGTGIRPLLIPRVGDDYHATEVHSSIASASAIRALIEGDGKLTNIKDCMPKAAYDTLQDVFLSQGLLYEDALSQALGYRLISLPKDEFSRYADCDLDLGHRIANHLKEYQSFTSFVQLIATKNTTHTRVNRALLHILLGIETEDLMEGKDHGYIPYLRVLGFRRQSAAMFAALKASRKKPLVTKVADAVNQLPSEAHAMLLRDIQAADLYNQMNQVQNGIKIADDYTHPLVIL